MNQTDVRIQYHIRRNFRHEANFATCSHWRNFYHANFYVNDRIEDRMTFTALAKSLNFPQFFPAIQSQNFIMALLIFIDVHPAGQQTGDTRLFGDPRNGYGAVEIYSSRAGWRGICPDFTWTDSDATTICQDLGYASGSIIAPITVSSSFRTTVQLYSPSCPPSSGDLVTLGVCSFQTAPSSTSVCTSNRFAALRCSK